MNVCSRFAGYEYLFLECNTNDANRLLKLVMSFNCVNYIIF